MNRNRVRSPLRISCDLSAAAFAASFALTVLAGGQAWGVFILTDKNNANPVAIPDGNTASDVYVIETRNNSNVVAFNSDRPNQHTVDGFTFDTNASVGNPFLTSPGANGNSLTNYGPNRALWPTDGSVQNANVRGYMYGYSRSLAGNETNGYVGTPIGQTWGNALHMNLNTTLVNGAGDDLYLTYKTLIGPSSHPGGVFNQGTDVANTTGLVDKSINIAVHFNNSANNVVTDATYGADWRNRWALYTSLGLAQANYTPQTTGDNTLPPLGGLDLSNLVLAKKPNNVATPYSTTYGNFWADAEVTGAAYATLPKIPSNAEIDEIILINNNVSNSIWRFYLGPADPDADPVGGFARIRDLDNADGDNNPFTGEDSLYGRFGTNATNGQNAPVAWFLGIINAPQEPEAVFVPEPTSLALLSLGLVLAAGRAARRRTLA